MDAEETASGRHWKKKKLIKEMRYVMAAIILNIPSWKFLHGSTHKAHPTPLRLVRYALYQWKCLGIGGVPDPLHNRDLAK